MSDLISRLSYGCGRLTGGASWREAASLIDVCVAAGVRRFDVAPYYGLGTAEKTLGALLDGVEDTVITTKVGIAAPGHGVLKSFARRAKRMISAGTRPHSYTPQPSQEHSSVAKFLPHEMHISIERSRQLLRRETLDCLLLHEIYPGDFVPAVKQVMDDVLARGAVRQIGYSNGAQFDPSTNTAFPPGYVGQAAIPHPFFQPGWHLASPREIILHSIANTGFYLKENAPEFANGLARASALASGITRDQKSLEVGIAFALASVRAPHARLILSSTDPARLRTLLGVLKALQGENLVQPVAGCFS